MPPRHRPREADSQSSLYFYHWRASFSFSLRGSHLHTIAQIHVSVQRHFVSLGQPRKHLIFIAARDSHLDIPPVHRVAVVSEHEMLSLVVTYRAPRYHQHAALFVNQNAHFHVHVRQQLYFVVIHRTEHLAHTARAARHHLLGYLLNFAVPYAVRHRVPQYLHALILAERTQVRFIHERAYAHMAQVRHFRQHVAQLHKITLAHRQRIERAIGRSDYGGRANFFFQRGYQVLLLLQAQAGALHSYGSALLERRLLLLIDLPIRARGRAPSGSARLLPAWPRPWPPAAPGPVAFSRGLRPVFPRSADFPPAALLHPEARRSARCAIPFVPQANRRGLGRVARAHRRRLRSRSADLCGWTALRQFSRPRQTWEIARAPPWVKLAPLCRCR